MLRASTLHDSSVASNVASARDRAADEVDRLRERDRVVLACVPLTSMSAVASATPSRARGSCTRPAVIASWIADDRQAIALDDEDLEPVRELELARSAGSSTFAGGFAARRA